MALPSFDGAETTLEAIFVNNSSISTILGITKGRFASIYKLSQIDYPNVK
jgi:hypothetical protein